MAPSTIAVLNGTARVSRHLIDQALAKGDHVRAIVRSTSRFYTETKKHDDLSAHEWKDFNDLAALDPILDGVDVIYVALSPPNKQLLEPVWLNSEAVASICTVLRNHIAPGARCKTKIVLLAAYSIRPDAPRHAAAEAMLGHQFNDLRAARTYLTKQESWLDVAYLVPGLILDSESSADAKAVGAVRLQDGGEPDIISYARLAAAMQLAGANPQWNGKFAVPAPTTPVHKGIKDYSAPVSLMFTFLTTKVLPSALKSLALASLFGAIGYVTGSRDGGAWAFRTLGVNVAKWPSFRA